MRPLNQLESVFRVCDRAAPFNFVVFAQISGPMGMKALQAACLTQLERFPRLTYSIDDGHGPVAAWVPTGRQPKVEMVGGPGLQAHLNQVLNSPFECPDEPLMRVRWYKSDHEQYLLLSLNHTVADGRSGLRLFESLVSDLGTIQAGGALGPIVPVDDPFFDSIEGPKGRISPMGGRQFESAQVQDRRTVVMPILFDEATTQKLVEKTRRFGVSMSGLIAACHGMSVMDVLGGPGAVSMSFPVDWRGRLPGLDSDYFGVAVGNAKLLYRLGYKEDIWALTRRLSGDLKRVSASAPPRTVDIDPMTIYQSRSSAAVSNVGKVSWSGREQGISVSHLGFAVSCSYFGDHILTATTHNGQLQMTYCVVPEAIPADKAQAIISDTVDALKVIAVTP
ncbi:MAG: hypothetical protein CMH52_08785 [Myxococcales bacterium]|nr:hypothetical protein [Myxococcales bacterium]|tara:strand:+ start:290 stop:1465 length:1176 start_codon:yes stop_codon:yes gene_type:complete